MGLGDSKLKFFADYILKELGVIYSPQVYFQLEQRIEKIAGILGLTDAEMVYQKAVSEGITGDFKQYLLDIATNNETSFFRDPKIFGAIENQILPSFLSQHPPNVHCRIWCAAASFGQEPYSLAMLVHEFLKKNRSHPRIEIVATDISDQALRRCKEARYSPLEIQRGLSASRIIEYFDKDEEGYGCLKPEIRGLVDFRKQNLLDSFGKLGTFNLILCRYVLIYQEADKKKDIIQRLEKCLVPKGFLVLGGSESIFGLSTELDQRAIDGAIYYQRKT